MTSGRSRAVFTIQSVNARATWSNSASALARASWSAGCAPSSYRMPRRFPEEDGDLRSPVVDSKRDRAMSGVSSGRTPAAERMSAPT
ncbi:MAG: hypothetical protein U0414_02520 [Polyangiaceae bacterium]